ncbi:MAG: hypothetical protein IKO65_05410 [Victivallales bacterium]|nr:hypothetical protein [Victivallales bacterium]
MHNFPTQLKLLCLLALVTLLNSCETMTSQLAKSQALYQSGQYTAAAAAPKVPSDPSKALLPNLYRASSHLMAAQYGECLSDFSAAEDGLQAQDASINWFDHYLGRTYDGLMLQTYQALVYLILGQPDRARVALNRLEEWQGKAARRNQRAIAKAQEEIKNERSQAGNAAAVASLDKANQNAKNKQQLSEYQHLLDQWGAYEDFASPAGSFLSGAFRLLYMEDRSDADKAVFQLRKTYGMTNSEPARQLYELAEQRAAGKLSRNAMDDYVVVLFENGLGPFKVERRYEIFIPLSRPVYAGIALPVLVEQPAAYPYLELQDGSSSLGRTLPLCSIDRLVATEFRKELPWIIASAVTKAVIKTTLQVIAMEVASKNYGRDAALVTGIIGSALAYATTNADVRGWNLLPKEYQAAVVPRPSSGRLSLTAPGMASSFVQVELPPGPSLVYVKIPVAGMPALVTVTGPRASAPQQN